MVLLEVKGHDLFDEFTRLVDSKCFAMRLPRNNIFVSVPGNILKHFVELERKWELHSSEEKPS